MNVIFFRRPEVLPLPRRPAPVRARSKVLQGRRVQNSASDLNVFPGSFAAFQEDDFLYLRYKND